MADYILRDVDHRLRVAEITISVLVEVLHEISPRALQEASERLARRSDASVQAPPGPASAAVRIAALQALANLDPKG